MGRTYYGSGSVIGPYGGTASGSINLREELAAILYGDGVTPAQGHWIIYRRFDLTTRPAGWSEEYREVQGNHQWVFTDEVLSTRCVPLTRGMMAFFGMELPFGGMSVGWKTYYLEYMVKPKRGDIIYELDHEDHSVKPSLGATATQMFVIKEASAYRGDNGRVEFYACLVKEEDVRL